MISPGPCLLPVLTRSGGLSRTEVKFGSSPGCRFSEDRGRELEKGRRGDDLDGCGATKRCRHLCWIGDDGRYLDPIGVVDEGEGRRKLLRSFRPLAIVFSLRGVENISERMYPVAAMGVSGVVRDVWWTDTDYEAGSLRPAASRMDHPIPAKIWSPFKLSAASPVTALLYHFTVNSAT